MWIAVLFMVVQRWKQSGCPSLERWGDNMWQRHTMPQSEDDRPDKHITIYRSRNIVLYKIIIMVILINRMIYNIIPLKYIYCIFKQNNHIFTRSQSNIRYQYLYWYSRWWGGKEMVIKGNKTQYQYVEYWR